MMRTAFLTAPIGSMKRRRSLLRYRFPRPGEMYFGLSSSRLARRATVLVDTLNRSATWRSVKSCDPLCTRAIVVLGDDAFCSGSDDSFIPCGGVQLRENGRYVGLDRSW